MAARLTDRQKKKIVADYLELGSYNAAAKLNGVSNHTVKRVVLEIPEMADKLQQKKEENTADILYYMEGKRKAVCKIIEVGLSVLPDKIREAKSASEVTTALGTLIDKWGQYTNNGAVSPDMAEDNRILAQMFKRGESSAE